MRFKRLITKIIIIAVIITTTSLIAVVKNHSFQGLINNTFRNSGEGSFTASPNPFEYFTVITVRFDEPVQGELIIEDSNGRLVRALHSGIFDGIMDFNWDGTNQKEKPVDKGVYYCHLNTGSRYTSRTIILILK